MKLHDLRNGKASPSIQAGDLLIWDTLPGYAHITRVTPDGRAHFVGQVTADVAQAIIDAGGEWCEQCYLEDEVVLATHIVTVQTMPGSLDTKFMDIYMCDKCEQDYREMLRVTWERASANQAAVDIVLNGSGARRDRIVRSSTTDDFLAGAGRI